MNLTIGYPAFLSIFLRVSLRRSVSRSQFSCLSVLLLAVMLTAGMQVAHSNTIDCIGFE
jgi:hypothetical protein